MPMLQNKKFLKIAGIVALALAIVACVAVFAVTRANTPDYNSPDAWAYDGVGAGKAADLFLVCPTVDMGKSGNRNMSLRDDATKANFVGALNMERGIYADSLTLYAPYYRQASFPVYSLPEKEAEKPFSIAYADVRSAFLHFAESTGDRPFVLAGFSQGSDMVLRLLTEFFDDPAYQDRLVAAYCIGWRLTREDVAAHPWLKPAQQADDTGVIICFSSEAETVQDSLIVPANVQTLAINPLNWKTDATPASAAENLGACFTNYAGEITEETPMLTGAYIDSARGTLKLPDIQPEDYHNSLFPDGVYHLYDYQFFFRNLQSNVAQRLNAYLAAQ